MRQKTLSPAAAPKGPLGLYIHIPFCRRKCLYCDFLSAPAAQKTIERYLRALDAQLLWEAANCKGYEVETVFFGGGTPSLLEPQQIAGVLGRIRDCYRLSKDAEITLESNPGTLTEEKLEGYRQAGVNRLSIGLQSAFDAELKALGRIHDYGTFLENYRSARQAGFSNINVDLMSALPGQTLSGWMDTLRRVAELLPEHISAYSLIIEEGTPFWDLYGQGRRPRDASVPPLPGEEEERRMYEQTRELLREYGYIRYEISNYARPGFACRHNVGYWTRRPYLGIGLGSASLMDNVRWKVTEDLDEYLNFFAPDTAGTISKEISGRTLKEMGTGAGTERAKALLRQEEQVLTKAEQMEEFLFLGLRQSAGIFVGDFRRQFGTGLREVYGSVTARLEEQGLLVFYEDGRRMKLTERGIDVSNYVFSQFLLEE